MADSVEDLTFNYTNEDGQLVRKELDKEVLSKGAWATVMYLYQDLDRRSNKYRIPKVSIVRYRKSNGVYRKQSSFNISSERQGCHIMRVLENWYSETCENSPRNIKKRQEAEKQAGLKDQPQKSGAETKQKTAATDPKTETPAASSAPPESAPMSSASPASPSAQTAPSSSSFSGGAGADPRPSGQPTESASPNPSVKPSATPTADPTPPASSPSPSPSPEKPQSDSSPPWKSSF
jgi:hypothetical protein